MRELNLTYYEGARGWPMRVFLYKTRASMCSALKRRTVHRVITLRNDRVMGVAGTQQTYKGSRSRIEYVIILNEDDYTYNTIVHECAHTANRLFRTRRLDWIKRADYEESYASFIGTLVDGIIQEFGQPKIKGDLRG